MKYLIYISIFIIVFSSFFFSIWYFLKLKRDIMFKILTRHLLKIQSYKGKEFFFSTYGIRNLIKCKILPIILSEDIKNTQKFLNKKNNFYAKAVFNAFINPSKAIADFEKLTKKNPQNDLFKAELAKLYFINGQLDAAENITEKINNKSCNYAKAVKYYINSIIATSVGDMLSTSQEASLALKLFEKEKAFFEMAQVYLQMGTIYRVSATNDIAQCMFEAAKSIFEKMNLNIPQAIALANLGMLLVAQNRYEEAENYFFQAQELNSKTQNLCIKAEILNQQALMKTTQKNYKEAEKLVLDAQKIHRKIKNKNGEALSWDILSYINFGKKKYAKTIETTQNAIDIYKNVNNISAIQEMLFMQANAYFETDNHEIAEKILRQIINLADEHKSCFHTANAYNLLGLIFLQKNNLSKAKSFFQQAVQREERNNRWNGAAVDYANLALIEKKCGNSEQAEAILETAIEYARNSGDENLIKQIKKQLKN